MNGPTSRMVLPLYGPTSISKSTPKVMNARMGDLEALRDAASVRITGASTCAFKRADRGGL